MELGKRVSRLLLNRYKQRKQSQSTLTVEHCLEAARLTAEHTRYCFMITHSGQAHPSARLVEPIFDEEDFACYIGTHPQSRKVQEIGSQPSVTLAFGNQAENANLVVYGTAVVSHDLTERRQYWKGNWRMFFPTGPEGDDYCVVKVRAERMEVLSFRHNVIPEPFGLRPMILDREGDRWHIR